MRADRPLLVLVGGFLGSGKTTLLTRAARMLSARGVRTAMITNDQAADLVDTALASRAADAAGEVAGGCFCCLFDSFTEALKRVAAYRPQIIFAEPVGSCADLVATVLRPMQDLYGAAYRVSPYTVLVDPGMAERYRNDQTDVGYLFRKQMEEADLVCFTKSDLGKVPQQLPVEKPTRTLSAKTGEGVEEWLDEISNGAIASSQTLLELDYSRYARAEAALGWLNATVDFVAEPAAAPAVVAGPLLDEMVRLLSERSISIAHLKLVDETNSGFIKAAVCGNSYEPEVEGDLLARPMREHHVGVNLRAEGAPEMLEQTVRDAVGLLPYKAAISRLTAFRPAEPRPTHRYSAAAS